MLITFKIIITVLLATIIIMPISFLCIIDKFNDDSDKTYNLLMKSFRGRFFAVILSLSFILFCLSCLSIFPLGVIWLIKLMWF